MQKFPRGVPQIFTGVGQTDGWTTHKRDASGHGFCRRGGVEIYDQE